MKHRHPVQPGGLPDRLLDVHEAAEMLAVKPATIYQWVYQRRIPAVKLLGRAVRFRLSDLQRLISEGERAPLRGRGVDR